MELFISNLDRTFLNQHAQISPVSRRILEELLHQDLPFSVASARTPFSVLPLLAGLPLRLPWVLMNGALLYDPARQHVPCACPLTPEARAALAAAEAEAGTGGLLFTLEEGRVRCQDL